MGPGSKGKDDRQLFIVKSPFPDYDHFSRRDSAILTHGETKVSEAFVTEGDPNIPLRLCWDRGGVQRNQQKKPNQYRHKLHIHFPFLVSSFNNICAGVLKKVNLWGYCVFNKSFGRRLGKIKWI
jgi:hypothetical protein